MRSKDWQVHSDGSGGMFSLIASITEDELGFIAGLDYGQDQERHLAALRDLIFKYGCQFQTSERWYPYEVIELGAHHLDPVHPREFAICTLLVIHAVRMGFDNGTDLNDKLSDRATDYDALHPELRAGVLDAFASFHSDDDANNDAQ